MTRTTILTAVLMLCFTLPTLAQTSSFLNDILNRNFGDSVREEAENSPRLTDRASTNATTQATLQENFDFALKVVGAIALGIAIIALLTGSILTSIFFFILFGVCLWLFQSEPLQNVDSLLGGLIDMFKDFIQSIVDQTFSREDGGDGNGGTIVQ